MPDPQPSKSSPFWNELYWFVVVGLVGWIVAALLLPPRVSGTLELLRKERRVLADLRSLEEQENVLEGAMSAMENDPFYREGVFRVRLGIKKDSEEYLEAEASPIR